MVHFLIHSGRVPMKRKQLCNQSNGYVEKKQNLKNILHKLDILYPVLCHIIIDYLNEIWKKNDFKFDFNVSLAGFIAVPDHFYVIEASSIWFLAHYNTVGQLCNVTRLPDYYPSKELPNSIDFDEIDNTIYVQYPSNMHIFDSKLRTIQAWNFFHKTAKHMFGFKIDNFQNDQMFISTDSAIWRCRKKTGEFLIEWQFQDDKDLNRFRGLTVTNELIYVCQCKKHQIEVIEKNTGKILKPWQHLQLVHPTRIHFDKKDHLLYVGDLYNVHVITSDGLWVEKLYSDRNEIERVIDFSVVGKHLYLLERNHRKRLHVWDQTM